MPARTGNDFIRRLKDGRRIWVGNDCVTDVASYGPFAGGLRTLASIFDLQHKHPVECLAPDPETCEPINVSHLIPHSKEDLAHRHQGLERVAEHTAGLLGRTPDYMNVTYAGFAGRDDEWGDYGNEEGAARLMEYQKYIRRHDLVLTHTIVHAVSDKSKGDGPRDGDDIALRKVGETACGIVVRGSRALATLAPFADELAVYPSLPLPPGADAYALSFCIPIATPGLHIICRDSHSEPAGSFDHPLSSRFDEQDAFVIFEDVEVPWDRVFIDANLSVHNVVMTTSWAPNLMQQSMIRAQTKLEFAWGLGTRMAEAINLTHPAAVEMLGEIWSYSEFARASIQAAEENAREVANGLWLPDSGPLVALRAMLPSWFPRVGEIIRLLGSHHFFTAPTKFQFDHPALRPLLRHYLRGARDTTAETRARIFRLAWDFAGGALAARNEQYERFYLGSGPRNRQRAHVTALFCRERADRLVDQFMNEAA